MSLAPDQEYIKDKFIDFLSSNTHVMGIQGYGGQGKTYLISHLIGIVENANAIRDSLGEANPFSTRKSMPIHLTATTNQAVNVLSAETKQDAVTVFNLLGLYPKFMPDSRDTSKYKRKRDNLLEYNSIVFIDEASYLDRDIYFSHIIPMCIYHQ